MNPCTAPTHSHRVVGSIREGLPALTVALVIVCDDCGVTWDACTHIHERDAAPDGTARRCVRCGQVRDPVSGEVLLAGSAERVIALYGRGGPLHGAAGDVMGPPVREVA